MVALAPTTTALTTMVKITMKVASGSTTMVRTTTAKSTTVTRHTALRASVVEIMATLTTATRPMAIMAMVKEMPSVAIAMKKAPSCRIKTATLNSSNKPLAL